MDKNLEEKRIRAYRNADETIRGLYGDLQLGELLGNVSQKFLFTEETKDIFIDIVGDIILGFYPKSSLDELLVQNLNITQETAKNVASELDKFLLRLPSERRVPDANITLKEKLELRPEGIPRPPVAQTVPNETAPQPLTREDVISALAARRTMAGDIESIKNSQGSEEK